MEEEFTVSRLSALIKRQLEINFSSIKLTAEVSALKIHFSGHAYFSLKDENAVIDAVCWKGIFQKNNKKLENGMKITCYGKVSSYQLQSKYQFIVEKFEEAGIGSLLQLLEERKKKLAEEGLFDLDKKKRIPRFPKIIGVITSPTGAVIRDILHRVRERFPSKVLICPVLVQGPEAGSQICNAVKSMNELPKDSRPDVLIVARGGGSFEDLMPFNEESVVRAVANSELPIISAVGHETDTTLIDYAADLRAPTPTAAAEFAVPEKNQLIHNINRLSAQLYVEMRNILKRQKLILKSHYILNLQSLLNEKAQTLDYLGERLNHVMFNHITLFKTRLMKINVQKPVLNFDIENIMEKIKFSFLLQFKEAKNKLVLINNCLESNCYTNILRKGFAKLETEKHIPVNSAKEAEEHSSFIVTFSDGQLDMVRKSKQTELF